MKRQITAGYVFTPASGAAAGTIDLSAVTGISLGALLAVINVTRNQLLYVAGQAGYGAAGYSGSNVLTLQASSQGHAAGDVLQIILDDGANPALDATVKAIVTALQGTLAVSGSVTATGGMLDSTGQSILNALKAQINVADLTVTDGTNYYIRREQSVNGALTVAFENMDGSAASPTVANLKPVTSTSRVVETAYYDVVTAATGYNVGDIIARVIIFDVTAAAVVASTWQNVTQGTTLGSAPAAANVVEQTSDIKVASTVLPPNAAQEAGGNLAAVAAGLGTKSDAVAASPGATASLIALIRLALTYEQAIAGAVANNKMQTAPQSNAPSVTIAGTVSAAGSAVTLPVDGYAAAVIQLAGTWSGTVSFQGSADGGATYVPVNMVPYSGGAKGTSASLNGLYETAIGGLTHIQAVASAALTSGSATVTMRATTGLKSLRVGTASGDPVGTIGTATAFVDRSGSTSSTVGAVTQLAPTNANRQYLRVCNLAAGQSTATIYVYDKSTGTPTTSNSIPIPPGGSWTWDAKVSSAAIQVFSSAASIAYEAAEG